MKKSKLYKLVQDSLNEILNEQTDREKVPNPLKDIPGPRVPGPGNTGGPGAEGIGINDPDISPMAPKSFTGFPIWRINVNNNSCEEVLINDFYICDSDANFPSFDYTIGSGEPTGAGITTNFSSDLGCVTINDANAAGGNNWTLFSNWLSGNYSGNPVYGGQYLNSQSNISNLLTPQGLNGQRLSQECPACYVPDLQPLVAPETLPDPLSGTNINQNGQLFNITPLTGFAPSLSIVNDGSCEFPGCDDDNFDNHFCTIYSGICSGLNPSGGVSGFSAITNNGINDCQYSGCIDVPTDPNYVCNQSVVPAICNNNTNFGALGNGTGGIFTNDNSVCQAIPGCTHPLMDNYNASANIDDGSCQKTVCDDPAAPNYICNQGNNWCDQQGPQGTFLTEYVHFGNTNNYGFGVGVTNYAGASTTSPITYAVDNGLCGQFGCTDDGQQSQTWWTDSATIAGTTPDTNPNYTSGNSYADLYPFITDYPGTDPNANTPNFQPLNYN